MKTTIVPAQVTSVEDRIAGNLSFSQILFLLGALFAATIIYMVLPIPFQLTLYKLPLIVLFSGVCMAFAIRLKGKILFQWFVIIAAYALRPRRYAFDKNELLYRDSIQEEKPQKVKAHAPKKQKVLAHSPQPLANTVSLEQILLNPNKNVRFAFSKKGGIHVSVSE